MYKHSDRLLKRYNSTRWAKLCHEIAKYAPFNYDQHGVYLADEWTSFYDIEKRALPVADYIKVEQDYIETALEIISKTDVVYVTIGYLEKHRFFSCSFEKRLPDYQSLKRSFNHIRQGQRILANSSQMQILLKLCLREKLWCILINNKRNFELSFGYDYYMIMHSALPETDVKDIVERHNLYYNPR